MSKDTKSNPFLDDDIDDAEFLCHPRQGQSGYLLGNDSSERNEWEAKRMQLLEERRRIEERTLQSSNTSLGLVYESEQVGILTAEELVRQREQLENIEDNLDIINSTMRTSQKHINSLKSIFGGIKNYFTKSSDPIPDQVPKVSAENPPQKHEPSKLQDTIGSLKADTKFNNATHPALRIRELPYDDDEDGFGKDVSKDRACAPPMSSSFSSDIDERLNKNLDSMSMGLGRLKNLAIGLNEEIEVQNEKIDLIHNKADKADETLEHQNRQIKRILKK